MRATQLFTDVKILNADVYRDGSFAEKTAVSVSVAPLKEQQHTHENADIDDFLAQDVKGPASFSCKSGNGCKFQEPSMNSLINDVFGDPYITVNCEGGECLHYSQVPGYIVRFSVFAESYIVHAVRAAPTETRQYTLGRVKCRGRHSYRRHSLRKYVMMPPIYAFSVSYISAQFSGTPGATAHTATGKSDSQGTRPRS